MFANDDYFTKFTEVFSCQSFALYRYCFTCVQLWLLPVAVLCLCICVSIVVPNNSNHSSDSGSSSSSDSGAIMAGAVGGIVLLLMIILVLCIVILCIRRSHRKKGSNATDNTTKLNTNVTMDHNPSYDIAMDNNPSYDVSKVDYSYDTINPRDSDLSMTTNPSYNIHTKPYSKTSEDEYNYVQPNELIQHLELDGYIKIYPTIDQSHGIQGIHSHPTANTPKQEEYGVVNQP